MTIITIYLAIVLCALLGMEVIKMQARSIIARWGELLQFMEEMTEELCRINAKNGGNARVSIESVIRAIDGRQRARNVLRATERLTPGGIVLVAPIVLPVAIYGIIGMGLMRWSLGWKKGGMWRWWHRRR